MSDWSITAKGLFFCEILLAQHGDVEYYVVLDHEEEVIF